MRERLFERDHDRLHDLQRCRGAGTHFTICRQVGAIGGLILGALAASPLALSLPITVTESVGMIRSIKRSLFLIKGRLLPALGAIFLCIAIASLGAAIRFLKPEAAIIGFIIEPILVSWAVSAWAHCIYISMTGR